MTISHFVLSLLLVPLKIKQLNSATLPQRKKPSETYEYLLLILDNEQEPGSAPRDGAEKDKHLQIPPSWEGSGVLDEIMLISTWATEMGPYGRREWRSSRGDQRLEEIIITSCDNPEIDQVGFCTIYCFVFTAQQISDIRNEMHFYHFNLHLPT